MRCCVLVISCRPRLWKCEYVQTAGHPRLHASITLSLTPMFTHIFTTPPSRPGELKWALRNRRFKMISDIFWERTFFCWSFSERFSEEGVCFDFCIRRNFWSIRGYQWRN